MKWIRKIKRELMYLAIGCSVCLVAIMFDADGQSRVPVPDETRNRLSQHVIGNKEDAAAIALANTRSLVAYTKGAFVRLEPVESAGEADIDISEAVYTGFTTLLTITPATGEPLVDLAIDLDWNKDTTGWDNVSTGADTLNIAVLSKVDGTNWRHLMSGTQVTANGNGTLDSSESGERFNVGMIGVTGEVRVEVQLSAERGDAEIPYRVTYRGTAPTITAVAIP